MIHYLIVKIFLSFSFWYMYYFLFNNKHTFYSNKNVLYLVVLMNFSKSIHLILLILNWHLVIYKNCKRVVKKLFKTNIQMKTCYVKLNTCIVKIYRAVKMKYSNWFAFCIVTYRNLSAAKFILLGIQVRTLAEELWYQRQTTISPESAPRHRNVTRKSLQRLSTLLHQPWIIVRLLWTPITTIFWKAFV